MRSDKITTWVPLDAAILSYIRNTLHSMKIPLLRQKPDQTEFILIYMLCIAQAFTTNLPKDNDNTTWFCTFISQVKINKKYLDTQTYHPWDWKKTRGWLMFTQTGNSSLKTSASNIFKKSQESKNKQYVLLCEKSRDLSMILSMKTNDAIRCLF